MLIQIIFLFSQHKKITFDKLTILKEREIVGVYLVFIIFLYFIFYSSNKRVGSNALARWIFKHIFKCLLCSAICSFLILYLCFFKLISVHYIIITVAQVLILRDVVPIVMKMICNPIFLWKKMSMISIKR